MCVRRAAIGVKRAKKEAGRPDNRVGLKQVLGAQMVSDTEKNVLLLGASENIPLIRNLVVSYHFGLETGKGKACRFHPFLTSLTLTDLNLALTLLSPGPELSPYPGPAFFLPGQPFKVPGMADYLAGGMVVASLRVIEKIRGGFHRTGDAKSSAHPSRPGYPAVYPATTAATLLPAASGCPALPGRLPPPWSS